MFTMKGKDLYIDIEMEYPHIMTVRNARSYKSISMFDALSEV